LTDADLRVESSDYNFKISIEEIKFNIETVDVWKDAKEMEIRLTNRDVPRENHAMSGAIRIDGKDFDKLVKALRGGEQ